jgi:signal transduction histidine kinase
VHAVALYARRMRWWRRNAGVRVRSTVAAAAIVALALLVATVAGWWLLRRALTNASLDAVVARSDDVEAAVSRNGVVGLDLDRQPVYGEVVQVIEGGQVVAAGPRAAAGLTLTTVRPAPGRSVVFRFAALPGSDVDEPYIFVARGVLDGATGRDAVVVVGRNLASLSQTLGTLGKLGLVGVPVLILVTGAGTHLFTGRSLAPVEDLRRRVQTITSRRLDERLPVPAVRDEIGRLAETMNDMLATLQTAQQAQRRFVADAGHELRSPLAVIATSVEVARAEEDDGTDLARLLDDVADETARMSRLVDGLLLLARADEHGLRTAGEDVDLDDLLEAEARRLRTAGVAEVALRTEPVRVVGDPDRLAQVLRNLTDNAKRHATSRIALVLAREGGEAVVHVEDDGPGIAPADRERVFERFVRLDASRQRRSGGSGLGLAIVREIVLGHGGTVRMVDTALGGAGVEVRLPLEVLPPAPHAAGPAHLAAQPAAHPAAHPPSGSSR